ncbi:hypothetical protein BB560_004215 [Smittium megazygosporum]|uniref:Uncharacterized protein n=1 Tax=Smittium megazygosporum TaxID=133381 RepID=A0A2T9Z9X7_9FUNG|nr:hypothetical protein BB560_004215 [Smittium megazygosporum]
MSLPGYRHQPHKQWVDPTPMPESVPAVDEIGASSAPLKSLAFFFGSVCKEYNEDYMLCRSENNNLDGQPQIHEKENPIFH